MLGCGIFTANTKGWRKFGTSYLIKLFTYFHLRPEVKEFFGINGVEDCPTHSFIYGELTETAEQQIFEANPTMQLKYDPYGSNARRFSYCKDHRTIKNIEAYKKLVREKNGRVYPFWEWLNFIRRALMWWVFRTDIKGWHQYFAWYDHCSELTARDIDTNPLPTVLEEIRAINFNVISPADLLNAMYTGIENGEIIYER